MNTHSDRILKAIVEKNSQKVIDSVHSALAHKVSEKLEAFRPQVAQKFFDKR